MDTTTQTSCLFQVLSFLFTRKFLFDKWQHGKVDLAVGDDDLPLKTVDHDNAWSLWIHLKHTHAHSKDWHSVSSSFAFTLLLSIYSHREDIWTWTCSTVVIMIHTLYRTHFIFRHDLIASDWQSPRRCWQQPLNKVCTARHSRFPVELELSVDWKEPHSGAQLISTEISTAVKEGHRQAPELTHTRSHIHT